MGHFFNLDNLLKVRESLSSFILLKRKHFDDYSHFQMGCSNCSESCHGSCEGMCADGCAGAMIDEL
jgi:hypothetical protein